MNVKARAMTVRLTIMSIILALFVAFNGQDPNVLISMLAYGLLGLILIVMINSKIIPRFNLVGDLIVPDVLVGGLVGFGFILLHNTNLAISLGAPASLLSLGDLGLILAVVGVAPLIEELGFRGWLMPFLQDVSKNRVVAVVGQALLFALFHFAAYGSFLGLANAPGLFVGAFVFGLVAGLLVRVKVGDSTKLERSIVAHMIFNAYLLNESIQFLSIG